jgi:hypothetical protein
VGIKHNFPLLIAFAVSLALSQMGLADTIIKGELSEPQIWSAEGSPYLVENDAVLLEGVPLTITSGAVVNFKNLSHRFVIKSSPVKISGTKERPIKIFGNVVVTGNFGNIVVKHLQMPRTDLSVKDGTGSLTMEYSEINYVLVHNHGHTAIKHSRVGHVDIHRGTATLDFVAATYVDLWASHRTDGQSLELNLKDSDVEELSLSNGRAYIEHNAIGLLNIDPWILDIKITKNNVSEISILQDRRLESFPISHNNINMDSHRSRSVGAFKQWWPDEIHTVNLSENYWGELVTQKMNAMGPEANIDEIYDLRDNDYNGALVRYSGWLQSPVQDAGPRSALTGSGFPISGK